MSESEIKTPVEVAAETEAVIDLGAISARFMIAAAVVQEASSRLAGNNGSAYTLYKILAANTDRIQEDLRRLPVHVIPGYPEDD